MRKTSLYEKKFRVLISEDSFELMKQNMSGTFKDFMNSLVGKTRRQIFDAGSFAFLYSGNKYGMTSAFTDEKNPEVLLSKFLQKLGDYINKDAAELRPREYETEEFKKKYDYYGEHKELEKQRHNLGKKAISLPSGPEKDAARSEFYKFENNGKYFTAMRAAQKKEDQDVEKFHNQPLKLEDLQNDGSGDYTQLGLMFQKIMRMRKGLTEDVEKIRKGGAGKSSYTGTRVHKDKKKEAVKKEGRKKVKDEDDSSYAGGAMGPNAATAPIGLTAGDTYAPGDARVPKALGATYSRIGVVGKKRRKKKNKK